MIRIFNEQFGVERITEIVSFGKVGAVGFVVDATLLMLLFHVVEWGHYESRLLSFSIAVAATWYLNRKYTFRNYTNTGKLKEYIVYFIVQTFGSLLNLSVYFLLISIFALMAEYPIIPLAIGAGIAMLFNYFASRTWVFKNRMEKI